MKIYIDEFINIVLSILLAIVGVFLFIAYYALMILIPTTIIVGIPALIVKYLFF